MFVFNQRTETRRSVILSHCSVSRFHNFHRSDIHTSAFAIGQGAGAVHAVKPAGDIVREMVAEAEVIIANIARLAKAS